MDKFTLNLGWKYCAADNVKSFERANIDAQNIDFPFDYLPLCTRDKTVVLGHQNSYFASRTVCFYNTLPDIKSPKIVLLSLAGVLGSCDVFVGGKFVAKANSDINSFVDITAFYHAGATVCLRIATHPDSGEYVGLGIAGEVAIFASTNHIYVLPQSIKFETNCASGKGEVKISLEVKNERKESQGDSLVLEVYNLAGKKVIRKARAIKLASSAQKRFEIILKAGSIKNWCETKTLYVAHIGLASTGLSPFVFGVRPKKAAAAATLVPCFIASNNGAIGAASKEDFLFRKYTALQKLGFNRMVFKAMPTETELQVLSKLGLYASVTNASDNAIEYGWRAKPQAVQLADEILTANILSRYPSILPDSDIKNIKELAVGMDYLGTELPPEDDALKPLYTTTGALDILANQKADARVAAITAIKGKGRAMGICQILVQDPDSVNPENLKDNSTDTHPIWNWPLHIGKKVKIIVHASGDIIALNLNGKSIGRKLAGRPFGYKAIFVTEFAEGTLEAISFARGKKDATSTLSSVGGARAIVANCLNKNIKVGECAYIDIAIADQNGSIIEFATKGVQVTVSEEGEFVAGYSTDNKNGMISQDGFVYTNDGRALVAVKGMREGKVAVEITGEGLRKAKVNLFVKI